MHERGKGPPVDAHMRETGSRIMQVEEKNLRPKGAKFFRINREMRETITVYEPILNEFRAKLMSNYKKELCRNLKFCLRNRKSKFEFII